MEDATRREAKVMGMRKRGPERVKTMMMKTERQREREYPDAPALDVVDDVSHARVVGVELGLARRVKQQIVLCVRLHASV
jgi:hypothetical protein